MPRGVSFGLVEVLGVAVARGDGVTVGVGDTDGVVVEVGTGVGVALGVALRVPGAGGLTNRGSADNARNEARLAAVSSTKVL